MRRFLGFVFISAVLAVVGTGCGDDDGGVIPRVDGGGVDGGGGGCTRPGTIDCGGLCVNPDDNPAHCGGCSMPCDDPSLPVCESGECRSRTTCPPGEEDCGGCVDTSMSNLHCGRCGNTCDTGTTCMDGSCEADMCPAGTERCGAGCIDTNTDAFNCGGCDMACEPSESCIDGSCSSLCDTTETACEVMDDDGGTVTICADTMTDPAHCGGYNMPCDSGEACSGGTCGCASGQTACSGVCVDTDTDTNNCGSCGMACPAGQSCSGGSCECPSGLTDCGGSCVNTDTDGSNCGSCGMSCASGESCSSGSCVGSGGCPSGEVDCGGTCTTVETDNMNCGMCGNACASGASCDAGVCRPDNDDRTDAITVMLPSDGTEATIMGSNEDATRDGPTISGCAANGPNVWYEVELTERGVLWVDTAGSMYDTAVFVTDSSGTPVTTTTGTSSTPGLCNDDCCGGDGDFTSSLQSCGGGTLSAGTYYISVGGFSSFSTGDFTLHVQFLPDTGFLYSRRLDGTGTTTNTVLVGTSEAAGMCGGGFSSRSGEDMRWFASCGPGGNFTMSTCQSDGGTYTRENTAGDEFDPVMYVWSGQTGAEIECNDDGGFSFNCRGTGGDSANFGSRIADFEAPRGINAVFIDSRGFGGSGMRYSMRYVVPSLP